MLLILVFSTVIVSLFLYVEVKRKKLPRGPYPLPIIGNLHQLIYYVSKSGGLVEGFNAIGKIYGKVFTIWIGPMPTVYIADYKIAYETHIKQSQIFSNRFSPGIFHYIREGRGIIASNGEFWQQHRRFALQTLRDFGVGRNVMEDKILNELNWLIQDFEKFQNKKEITSDASSFFDLLVGSIINQLLVSKRFSRDDERFEKLKNNISDALKKFGLFELFCPLWIQKWECLKWRQGQMFGVFDWIHEFCLDEIKERVSQPANEQHEDFLDVFIDKIEKDKTDGNNNKNSSFTLETLSIDMLDLWIAGQETTSTTLTWAGVCLLNNPDVQKKARVELIQITGGTRNLSLSDKKNTPYLNAVINEIQRIASILNINLLRKTNEDTLIDGQPLQEGTVITTQLSMLHTDEGVFKNHKQFRPERFLEDEQLEKMLIPFGIGKRVCLGESLARAELFLILGNILLRYDIKCADNTIPKMESISPFAMMKKTTSL
ncbi:unnamed protein product [Caenorhabditis angaria]|uniref:CYtochrome P450 family n=1 Tax=Caenorhabditis angaria TaxID=860376 RepID=A0A9P1N4L2_9PELO|nr:unnamed protein product [Caenorhabditis angaria]